MSRWADSTDDDDDYLHEGDHEDFVDHAVAADEVSVCVFARDRDRDRDRAAVHWTKDDGDWSSLLQKKNEIRGKKKPSLIVVSIARRLFLSPIRSGPI